jgi:two-component system chemotaxis response regulator CheB
LGGPGRVAAQRDGARPGAPGCVPVVVVDDSPAQRRYLRAALEVDGDVQVVGEARDGREAVALVARLRPGAVVLDLHLPGMCGLEAIEHIMAATPTPILVWSAFVTGSDRENAIEALAAGAVDVVPKPGPDDDDLERYSDALRRRLRVAARVRVITHPRGRLRASGVPVRVLSPAADRAGAPEAAVVRRRTAVPEQAVPGQALPEQAGTPTVRRTTPPAPAHRPSAPRAAASGVRLVVLGASTGGPQAVLTVLGGLPVDLQPAVLVVQHMAASFVPGLVDWLDDMLPLPVLLGADGDMLHPGTVTVAPSGGNLVVRDERLHVACVPAPPGQHHVPGIDVTLTSVADVLGPRAVGVLLTGMGRDGAAGLLRLRDTGAATIVQDEATSAVYGMPAAAVAVGAASRQLPIGDVAAAVLDAVGLARA